MIIIALLILLALAGIVMTSVQVFKTWRFMRKKVSLKAPKPERTRRQVKASASGQNRQAVTSPHVSILKPLCGLEDGLEENLISFTRLQCLSYEVIFSVADPCDPALEVVESVRHRYPDAPLRHT